MRSFASDNNSGVHPEVLLAIEKANSDHAVGYGDDWWTQKATEAIKRQFTKEVWPYFVFNGTGSNMMALDLITQPYHSIFCAETAHIYVDECGAPARFTGCQIRPIVTPDGKLTPEMLSPYMAVLGEVHHSQPGAIYISQATELGTLYTPEELRRLTDFAHQHGLLVHMDGARIANVCAALGCTLEAITLDCGIDTLSFGGTKNGLMLGECVVVLNEHLRSTAEYVRKQTGQLASKMRFLSAQFLAYMENDLWLKNATHANNMAGLLERELRLLGIEFTQKRETNQLFLLLPQSVSRELLKDYFFYFWNEARGEVRLVTSFDTTEDDIMQFIDRLRSLL
ncbi:MAG: low specificity L-threonine aldolase [Alloprevotella sp.]|nr:low specificity L-threonine aldolase [Alloprevotella sp.]